MSYKKRFHKSLFLLFAISLLLKDCINEYFHPVLWIILCFWVIICGGYSFACWLLWLERKSFEEEKNRHEALIKANEWVNTASFFQKEWLETNRSIFIDFSLILDKDGRLYEESPQPAKYDPFRVTAAHWFNPYIYYE